MSTDTTKPTTNATTQLAAPMKSPVVKKRVVRKSSETGTPNAKKRVGTSVKTTSSATLSNSSKKSSSTTNPKPNAKTTTKPVKPIKKPKLVRDSFTFPKDEYQAIAALKVKALSLKHSAKKSEILRAGLMLISSLNDKAFLVALSKVPALKTGRPSKS